MNYKKLSLGLGFFSLGLGAAELLASRRIARALDAQGNQAVIKAFGGREILAGLGLVQAPAHATRVWNRVAGDMMDLAALALAARHSPRNKAVWGSLAFVLGATALDVCTAVGLDRLVGKTWPGQA